MRIIIRNLVQFVFAIQFATLVNLYAILTSSSRQSSTTPGDSVSISQIEPPMMPYYTDDYYDDENDDSYEDNFGSGNFSPDAFSNLINLSDILRSKVVDIAGTTDQDSKSTIESPVIIYYDDAASKSTTAERPPSNVVLLDLSSNFVYNQLTGVNNCKATAVLNMNDIPTQEQSEVEDVNWLDMGIGLLDAPGNDIEF